MIASAQLPRARSVSYKWRRFDPRGDGPRFPLLPDLLHPVTTPRFTPAGSLGRAFSRITTHQAALDSLLRERLYGLGTSAWFPALGPDECAALDRALTEARLRETVRIAVREEHWLEAMDALHRHGISAIALKGFALARALYDTPSQRPSLDMDVIVDINDVPRIHELMPTIGWSLPYGVRGQYTSHQFTWAKGDEGPTRALIDFHWRITNRPALSRFLTHNHLHERATTREINGRHVTLVHPIDALLHAVIHIVAHHRGDAIPALWYVDIALLEASLRPDERVTFVRNLAANGISSIAAKIWRDAHEIIGFEPHPETRWLLHSHDARRDLWQQIPENRGSEIIADLMALRVEDRLHYLRELLLPNERSLRIAFGDQASDTPLWQLRLRRIVQGGVRRSPKKGP